MREVKFRAYDKRRKVIKPVVELAFWDDAVVLQENEMMMLNRTFSQVELMQYTGLKDKSGVVEVYEGDIIDMNGNIKGNIYESPQIYEKGVDCLIEGMGTSTWRNTESIAMGRGCRYAK